MTDAIALLALAMVAGALVAIWDARREDEAPPLEEIQRAHRAHDARIRALLNRRSS